MRLGLFSAIDSQRVVGGPVPARPCISGPRALTRLSSTLRSVQYSTRPGLRVVATSMAMNQSWRAVELMNALDASPSNWLVRLVIEWHY